MIEFFILICAMATAYCVGNMMGWESGKKHGAVRERVYARIHVDNINLGQKYAMHIDRERAELIDHVSRQSLAFSQKQKQWIKVYDADVEQRS